VDHHVGALEERGVASVGAVVLGSAPRRQVHVVGLVVGGVHDDGPVRLDAEREGEGGVVQVLRTDRGVTDLEDTFHEVVVAHLGRHLIEADREVLVLHLPRQHAVERADDAAWAVHVPVAPRNEQRGEEREPVDVVPVGVPDEDRPVGGVPRSAASFTSVTPSARAPVPQSSTRSWPASVRISTHEVLPP
jgi:hypothetical protein